MKKSLICLLCLAVACTSYETIEDRDMEEILSEALLTNAIASREAGYAEAGSIKDTVDFYTPILERYDYTLDDFRGTIREMATRKSNPLAEIFTRVNKNLDSLAAAAEYRYNVSLRYDSLALAYFADTLYFKDTTIRGSLAKWRVPISKPKKGGYRFAFVYRSTEDYRVGSKSVVFHTKKGEMPDQRFWIDRSTKDTAKFAGEFKLLQPADTLVVSFQEPVVAKRDAKLARDTSFVRRLILVHTPPIEQARRDYILRLFQELDFLAFTLPNEKDSLPLPFRR